MNHHAALGPDTSSTYRIYLDGVQAGHDVALVAASLALRFKRPAAKVATLLDRPAVLKRGLSLESAQRYAATLERTGCKCSVQPDADSAAAADAQVHLLTDGARLHRGWWVGLGAAVLFLGAVTHTVIERQAAAMPAPSAAELEVQAAAPVAASPSRTAGLFKARDVARIVIARDGTIYAGASPGLYRSVDGGSSWTQLKGIDTSNITLSPEGHLFAIERGQVFKSTDRGENFVATGDASTPNAEAQVGPLSAAGGKLFAAHEGLTVSADGGKSWQYAFKEFDGGAIHTARDGTLYFGSDTIVASSDKGRTWTKLPRASTQPTPFMALRADGTLMAATYALSDPGAVRVWATRDKGKSWSAADNGLPRTVGYNVICLLALADGAMLATGYDGDVYRLPAKGSVWSKSSRGLPGTAKSDLRGEKAMPGVHTIAQAPNGHVYAGTRHGVFVSRDGGENWSPSLPFQTWF